LDSLPPANHHLLHFLFLFLKDLSAHSATTLMGISNLAIVFAGNLLRAQVETDSTRLKLGVTKRIMEVIISHADTIFDKAKESDDDANWYDSLKKYMILNANSDSLSPTPSFSSLTVPTASAPPPTTTHSPLLRVATMSESSSSSSSSSSASYEAKMIASHSFISLKLSGDDGDNADEASSSRPRRNSDPEKTKSSPEKAKRKSEGRNNSSQLGEKSKLKLTSATKKSESVNS